MVTIIRLQKASYYELVLTSRELITHEFETLNTDSYNPKKYCTGITNVLKYKKKHHHITEFQRTQSATKLFTINMIKNVKTNNHLRNY